MPYYNNYSDSDDSDEEYNYAKKKLYELYTMFISDNKPKNINHAFYSIRNLINELIEDNEELENENEELENKKTQINYITNYGNKVNYNRRK